MGTSRLLLITQFEATADLFHGIVKARSSDGFVIDRASNSETAIQLIESQEYGAYVIQAPIEGVGAKKVWSAIRTKDLSSSSAPIIWIGPTLRDSRFLAELETGKAIQVSDGLDHFVDFDQAATSFALLLDYLHFSHSRNFGNESLALNQVLFKEGDVGDAVYVLVSGKLEVFKEGDHGETLIGKIEPGEFVGEMCYLTRSLRTAGVRAAEPCQLIKIPFAQFESLVTSKISWSNKLLQLYSKRLLDMNRKAVAAA